MNAQTQRLESKDGPNHDFFTQKQTFYSIIRTAVLSVTRLGHFRKLLMTNILTKVAQIFGFFLVYFEKHNFR